MNHDASAPVSARVPARAVAPTRGEGIAALASQVVGGPLGARARVGSRGWHPAAAVLSALSSVFVALGVLQKNHCVTTGWATPGSLWRACYSDLPVAVAAPGGSSPWADPTVGNQPPLTAIVTWLVRGLVPDGSQLRLQQGMFAGGAALVALLVALAVCVTAATVPRGPWLAAHLALSPVLVTVSLVSFDALAVALVTLGLFAWHRARYVASGAALMAALLTRPSLGVVLVAVMLMALQRRVPRALSGLAVGAAAVAAVVLGGALAWGGDPFASFETWRSQPASYGSLWYVLSFAGVHLSSTTLTLVAVLGWVGAVALAWVLMRSEPAIGPEPVALLMLVLVVVTSRAVPVQASLWALPLIALCAIRWQDHLTWAVVELFYFALVWSFVARDSNPAKALPQGWYAALVGVRVVAWFVMARAALVAAGDLEAPAGEPMTPGSRSHPDRRGVAAGQAVPQN